MAHTEKDELMNKINDLRKDLILLAREKGLNSDETVCCSQYLDELIMIYQKTHHSTAEKAHSN